MARQHSSEKSDAPRETNLDLAPGPTVAVAPWSFPWVTTGLLVLLAAVFAAEIQFGVSRGVSDWEPSIATLTAFGGSAGSLVFDSGQWYRLLSASFLHKDGLHLILNGAFLALAGYRLEHLLGRTWFIAAYFISELCGSLVSVLWNSPFTIGVGASDAIMGLYVTMYIVSFHFAGRERKRLQRSAAFVLILAVLQILGEHHGIDLAGHTGGAIGGAITALFLLRIWSPKNDHPGEERVAQAIAGAGLLACLYPIIPIVANYSSYTITDPAGQLAQRSDTIRRNPNDSFALWSRGNIYLSLRDYDHAIADYSAVIRLWPNFAEAFNNRCWAYALAGQMEQALPDCNDSLRLQPNDSNTLDSRGFVHLKIGTNDSDFRNAIADYDASLNIAPKLATALYGRGLAKRMIGDVSSETDIAAATAIKSNIAEEFTGYGIPLDRFKLAKH